MRRFFVDKISDNMTLSGENHNHLSYVLRAKKGEEIILCNNDGFDYTAKITDIKKDETFVSVIKKEKNLSEPDIDVTLFFAALKGDKNDLVIQKATELGVREICPIITKFVQIKKDSLNIARLNKIALESCKQCSRAVLPLVSQAIDLTQVITKLNSYDAGLFFNEREEKQDIKAALQKLNNIKNIAVIIGSEGGFDKDEAQSLIDAGAISVSMGKRILRAETASISALSIVMYETGQMKI